MTPQDQFAAFLRRLADAGLRVEAQASPGLAPAQLILVVNRVAGNCVADCGVPGKLGHRSPSICINMHLLE